MIYPNLLNKRIIFIEGGGYTISDFYKKNILNRLHLCISPTIIGDGKNSFLIEKVLKNRFLMVGTI